ncbi:hypothetical protein ACWGAN_28995 [Streptomyces sp. NPDC054945]
MAVDALTGAVVGPTDLLVDDVGVVDPRPVARRGDDLGAGSGKAWCAGSAGAGTVVVMFFRTPIHA